jgi:hypothetical protein
MLGEKRTGALLEKTGVMVGEMRHLYYNWPHELCGRFARRITHKAGRALHSRRTPTHLGAGRITAKWRVIAGCAVAFVEDDRMVETLAAGGCVTCGRNRLRQSSYTDGAGRLCVTCA